MSAQPREVFPVIYGICLDAEAIWLGKAPENARRPVLLSHGTYEIREGLAPLLDLLDRHAVKTTFFVPGITADCYPDAIHEINRRGHELALCKTQLRKRVGHGNTRNPRKKTKWKAGIHQGTRISKRLSGTWF
jgi:hypothetical protein